MHAVGTSLLGLEYTVGALAQARCPGMPDRDGASEVLHALRARAPLQVQPAEGSARQRRAAEPAVAPVVQAEVKKEK
jgi:hypothetical protein